MYHKYRLLIFTRTFSCSESLMPIWPCYAFEFGHHLSPESLAWIHTKTYLTVNRILQFNQLERLAKSASISLAINNFSPFTQISKRYCAFLAPSPRRSTWSYRLPFDLLKPSVDLTEIRSPTRVRLFFAK